MNGFDLKLHTEKNNKIKILFLLLLSIQIGASPSLCIAQSNIPSAINFQSIARDGSGNLVTNTNIEVQFTILDGGPLGTALRQPRFIRNTDQYGQFSLTLSEDSATSFGPSGATLIPNIDWASGNKWIKIEFRPNLISPYTLIETIRCNSTFYAFAAKSAEKINIAGVNGQVLKHNGTTWVAGADNLGPAFQAPTIQKFLSGSGIYTPPPGVLYIEVEMVGGGGPGGGPTNLGGPGVSTTFGLMTAGGALINSSGGIANIGPYSGIAFNGGTSNLAIQSGLTMPGPSGASSPFGGAGGGSAVSAVPNTGSGGGGVNGASGANGSGGGAGAYIKAMIPNPVGSFNYSVAGPAPSGSGGGTGASGIIIVREFYQ